MAGKECPKCRELTFHETSTGRECSKCGYKAITRPGGGRGSTCSMCGKFQVFERPDGKKQCRGCGTIFG